MQPGEAIFLLNYEDICFVMKDWPRPGTSTSTIQTRTPVPSQCHSGCGIQRSLALCNPCSTGNCRRVAPVFFFFFRFVSFCFVSHCSSVPCYGFVALLFLLLATRMTLAVAVAVAGCVFNLVPQAAAANRESSTLPSSGAYTKCTGCWRCK